MRKMVVLTVSNLVTAGAVYLLMSPLPPLSCEVYSRYSSGSPPDGLFPANTYLACGPGAVVFGEKEFVCVERKREPLHRGHGAAG
jgi:hypothetical protein